MHFYKKKSIFFRFFREKISHTQRQNKRGWDLYTYMSPVINAFNQKSNSLHHICTLPCSLDMHARTHTHTQKKNSNISVHLFGRINKITCFPSQCMPAFYFDNVCKAAEHTILKIITFAKCCSSSLPPPRMFLCLMINTAKDPTYIKNIN